MLNFIQLTRVPLCLSLVRSLSQQSSEVSSRVKWNESLFNCLEFHWKLLRFLLHCWIYCLMLGLCWKNRNFLIFKIWKRPNEVRRCWFETFLFYLFLQCHNALHNIFKTNYNIYSLIILILKCSNTCLQKTPGHPCGWPINVPAPYVRQWYELLNRLYSQRVCQRSAWTL